MLVGFLRRLCNNFAAEKSRYLRFQAIPMRLKDVFSSDNWCFILVGGIATHSPSLDLVYQMHRAEMTHSYPAPAPAVEALRKMLSGDESCEVFLLLDAVMPDASVWEVADTIASFPRDMKARIKVYILLSAHDWDSKAKVYCAPSIDGYIDKPFSITDFEDLILKPHYLSDNDC